MPALSAVRIHEDLLSAMAASEADFRAACRSARETANTGNDALFALSLSLSEARARLQRRRGGIAAQVAVRAACEMADNATRK